MRFLIPLILIPSIIGVGISHFVYDTFGIGTAMKCSLLVYVIGYIISVLSFTFLGGYDNQKAQTMKDKFQWGVVFSIVWPWVSVVLIRDKLKNKK